MPTLDSDHFGCTRAGAPVTRYTLANEHGLRLQCLTYGATITTLAVPDRDGMPGDVVLGFDALAPYETHQAYLGAVVGRYANRLGHGRFVLDGTTYDLPTNEGRHHLHGGPRGFDKHVWQAQPLEAPGSVGVRFSRRSPSGEQGYPGDLEVAVTYVLGDDTVSIEFTAQTSASTILNLTQHAYFDLSAGAAGTILGHDLAIDGAAIVEVDADLIPTGRLLAVADTPFDFRAARPVGHAIDGPHPQLRYGGGYDHTWVLFPDRGGPLASLRDPQSGRRLDIRTTEPGIQCYAGNRLDLHGGKGGRRYGPRSGICLETQHLPDSPAHPQFPSTVLRPGEVFRSVTTWTFSAS